MLQGKRALVVGVANARSIAWGIANRWRQEGAEVFVTYQEADIAQLWRTLQERGFCSSSGTSSTSNSTGSGENERRNGQEEEEQRAGSRSGGGGMLLESEGAVFGRGRTGNEEPGKKAVDVILHSVAHAPTDAMRQGFLMGTTREAFVSAHVVSAYSLVSTVRHALPFLSPGASVMALTYIGSQRAAANYNVMGPAKASLESCARALALELGGPRREHGGAPDSPVPGDDGCGSLGPGGVRVNCLSAGPVRTMAARGITGFDEMRREAAGRAPLGEGLAGVDEIAGVATFLASPLLSAAVTGQTLYADRGFSSVV